MLAIIYTTKEFNYRSLGNYIRDLEAYRAGRLHDKPVAATYMFMQGDRPRKDGYVAVASGKAVLASSRSEAIEGLIKSVNE